MSWHHTEIAVDICFTSTMPGRVWKACKWRVGSRRWIGAPPAYSGPHQFSVLPGAFRSWISLTVKCLPSLWLCTGDTSGFIGCPSTLCGMGRLDGTLSPGKWGQGASGLRAGRIGALPQGCVPPSPLIRTGYLRLLSWVRPCQGNGALDPEGVSDRPVFHQIIAEVFCDRTIGPSW